MNIQGRYEEESNLLRSHYYLLRDRYTESAVPIKIYGNVVYLHKNFRGYVSHKFTHKEFMSIIRVLGMGYFKIKITNAKEVIKNYNNYEDKITSTIIQTPNQKNKIGILDLNGYVNFDSKLVHDTTISFEPIDLDEIKTRNTLLFGGFEFAEIENNDDTLFNYNVDVLNIVHFFKYINLVFNAQVSNILQNPISAVFLEYTHSYEIYKISKNKAIFIEGISPSLYDLLITNTIFSYIKNIASVNYIYNTPTR